MEDTATVDQALAALGLKIANREPTLPFGIWPENVAVLNVYGRLHGTQWRTSATGAVIGLDYSPLAFFLELERVPRERWPSVVDGVQVMESEVMRLVRKKAQHG